MRTFKKLQVCAAAGARIASLRSFSHEIVFAPALLWKVDFSSQNPHKCYHTTSTNITPCPQLPPLPFVIICHFLATPQSERNLRQILALSGSVWLSIALRICLQSPCLAHKSLARLGTSFLSSSTLISPGTDMTDVTLASDDTY